MKRLYTKADYPVILECCRKAGRIIIHPLAAAFDEAGIEWPNLNSNSTEANLVDADILRAWQELGYTSK